MLADKNASLSGNRLPHVFFNSSGSEANDTVFRMVRRYWELTGEPQRKVFISRWNAYHGSTVAGDSLGGMQARNAICGLPIPGFENVRQRQEKHSVGKECVGTCSNRWSRYTKKKQKKN